MPSLFQVPTVKEDQIFKKHSSSDTASHPKRLEFLVSITVGTSNLTT